MSRIRTMRELLAVSMLGAVAATGCFVVDDSGDDDENGGEAGEGGTRPPRGGSAGSSNGGSSNGGTSNGGTENGGTSNGGTESGGTSSGGTSAGMGGSTSGGSGPTGGSAGGGGEAVMKFCNGLQADGMDIVLTVEFQGVEASANSGVCTPVVPNACIPVPTGENPTVVLMDDTGSVITEGSFPTAVVEAGMELVLEAGIDEVTQGPTVNLFELNEGYPCSETDPYADQLRSVEFAKPFARDRQLARMRAISEETRADLTAYRIAK